tara:strand:- start:67 stop:972 length:906 start_codon:yes stop_codon:yes gene_type:complete
MKIIFLGAGYCTRFIIPLVDKKTEIICTHKDKITPQRFDKNLNLKRFTFRELIKEKESIFDGVNVLLNSIPPKSYGDLVVKNFSDIIIKKKKTINWFGYFSSTSVYGDHSGNWVDEKTELIPNSQRGIIRKKSELQHLKFFKDHKIPIHIFRLPGIYGPGRSVIDKFKEKEVVEILKEGHFFSRIHVEDIATAITKSLNKPTPGEIFNICDDLPTESYKVLRYAARLMNAKILKSVNFDNSKISPKIKSFYNDNKRVKNGKIKKILHWTPKFRTYKLGLKNIYKSDLNENSSSNITILKKN